MHQEVILFDNSKSIMAQTKSEEGGQSSLPSQGGKGLVHRDKKKQLFCFPNIFGHATQYYGRPHYCRRYASTCNELVQAWLHMLQCTMFLIDSLLPALPHGLTLTVEYTSSHRVHTSACILSIFFLTSPNRV
jgi:hypothetical protein